MAWEWVGPVAAASSSAIVGSVGIWATFKAGREGRLHAEKVAQDNAAHAISMARDERRGKRFESAYVELLMQLRSSADWTNKVLARVEELDPNFPVEFPAPSDSDEVKRAEALVLAYGSRTVKLLHQRYLSNFYKAQGEVLALTHAIEDFLESDDPGDQGAERALRATVAERGATVQETLSAEPPIRHELILNVAQELQS